MKTTRIVMDQPLPGILASFFLIDKRPVRIMGLLTQRYVYEFPSPKIMERAMGIKELRGMTMAGMRQA